MRVVVLKMLGTVGPRPLGRGVVVSVKYAGRPNPRVLVNVVVLGQTVRAGNL